MRKFLFSFVFASILVLAGSVGFARENEPSDGGTVPEYEVWLPVVEWPYGYAGDLSNLPDDCPYRAVLFTPEDEAVITYGDMITFTWTVVDRNGYVVPEEYADPETGVHVQGSFIVEGKGPRYTDRIKQLDSTKIGLGRWQWAAVPNCAVDGYPGGIREFRSFTIVNP